MDTNNNELFKNRHCNECNSSDSVEIIKIGGNGIALCMGCRNKLRRILGIEQKPIGIELRNIDLTGLTPSDELNKLDEERKELIDALLNYLYEPTDANREHLIEEVCDNMQVPVSLLGVLGIGLDELITYWNKVHNEKIKSRPRKEDNHE